MTIITSFSSMNVEQTISITWDRWGSVIKSTNRRRKNVKRIWRYIEIHLCGMCLRQQNQSNHQHINSLLLISFVFFSAFFSCRSISTNPFNPTGLEHVPITDNFHSSTVRMVISWSPSTRTKASLNEWAKFPFLDCEILVSFYAMIQTKRPIKTRQMKTK